MPIIQILQELSKIFVYIVVPALAGITFFALAKFVKEIAPLRVLVSSEQTYQAAFWGFLFFGFYLILRPVQVLAGPHPWPLVISCLREFLLIAVFGPSAFIGLLTLSFGPEKINKKWIVLTVAISLLMAVLFCWANYQSIGGSKEIVKLGTLTAYDGLWFENRTPGVERWMNILFWVRLINPGFLLLLAAAAVFWHGWTYPVFKKRMYDNMPKKLFILSGAVCVYAVSLMVGSWIYGVSKVPDEWGIYHLGSLVAGILEAVSLSMPVRNDVQVSEHEI